MKTQKLVSNIATHIIEADSNPIRFERFCQAAIEAEEGFTLLPTSVNYDLGRDGRGIGRSKGKDFSFLCCTLNESLDTKIEKDLIRLKAFSDPDLVFFCSSQRLTEYALDKVEKQIKDYFPNCKPRCLGSVQLGKLAENHPELFRDTYHSEVRNVELTLLAFQNREGENDDKGLRLALLAFGSPDSEHLKNNLSLNAVIHILNRQSPLSEQQISEQLSAALRLPKNINSAYLLEALNRAEFELLVSNTADGWVLTERGAQLAEGLPTEAAQTLIEGRKIVRDRIEELIGQNLGNIQYELIWSTFQDQLTDLFHTHALSILQAVRAIVSNDTEPPMVRLDKLLQQCADKSAAHIQTENLRKVVRQAIVDVFTERQGAAFEWLAKVCERFVCLCALGLESRSASELQITLTRYEIVLDTDIVLTYLCESEPDHAAARDLLLRWLELGGKILLAVPVLEEVAYHAWSAQRVFNSSSYLVGKISGMELRRFAENAFVRAFLHNAASPKQARFWSNYINQFKGGTKYDYTKVFRVLQSSLASDELPNVGDQNLQSDISHFLQTGKASAKKKVTRAGGDSIGLTFEDVDKADRDGKLLCSVVIARKARASSGSRSTVVVLSSSSRLRKVDQKFRLKMGSPQAVFSPSALTYFVSMVPGVSLGAATLRRALFDFGEGGDLHDTERIALKVIKGSGVYDLPWAQRVMLQDSLEDVIAKEAEKRGINEGDLRSKFLAGDPSSEPEALILRALEEIAVDTESQKRLTEARKRIAELEGTIEQLSLSLKAKK